MLHHFTKCNLNAIELLGKDELLESAKHFSLIADSDLYSGYMKRKLASFDLFSLVLVRNEELILDDIAYIYLNPLYAYSSMFLDSVFPKDLFFQIVWKILTYYDIFFRNPFLQFNYYHGCGIDNTYTF